MEDIEIKIDTEEKSTDDYEAQDEALRKKILEGREARRKKRKRKLVIQKIVFTVAAFLITVAVLWGIGAKISSVREHARLEKEAEIAKAEAEKRDFETAKKLAAGYDYDAAIEKIKEIEDYQNNTEMTEAIAEYERLKAQTVRYEDVKSITHVFFHTLIADTALAFDGDYKEDGYNQYMTTVSEFNRMMEEMYKRGYVLVDIHDIAKCVTGEDGSKEFTEGDIYLPEGKIPFVMSQDDVSYYDYMTGDGFATKIVIGEDNMPTCEYVKEDGSVVYGEYDLVPLLEKFIDEHPDFSYRGARATLAITGYNGVLGYRTCPTEKNYDPKDIPKAKEVAQRMRECGWTFASHTWGHQKYGKISFEKIKEDAMKWENEVRPILGDVDTLIYANGFDIAGIENYSGEKFELLKSLGFDYYCNVDSSKYWVQIRKGYVRQGRRNLDGYRMWYSPNRLDDLFDVEDVWDESRPTPVKPI